MPNERRWAVNNTRQFLVDLMDPKKTPRVPKEIRKEAYRNLKHYPGEYYMDKAAVESPEVFGDWKAARDLKAIEERLIVISSILNLREKLMSEIIRNALRTPDGTEIRSRHRHDYVTYTDANGKEYMVDGGLDYIRRSANGDEEDMVVTTEDSFEVVRQACDWGTYGINGDQPLSYIKLCDMETAHIEAVLQNVSLINPAIKTSMERELEYRK